jgi:hypothetical protein
MQILPGLRSSLIMIKRKFGASLEWEIQIPNQSLILPLVTLCELTTTAPQIQQLRYQGQTADEAGLAKERREF